MLQPTQHTLANTMLQVIYQPTRAGSATALDFQLHNTTEPVPATGELLVQPLYLSTDPYLYRMLGGKSAHGTIASGTVMSGRAVARVLVSSAGAPAAGTLVLVESCDWAERAVVKADMVSALDESTGVSYGAWLGVLGTSGISAWVGLLDVARPRAGETVVVSAAAGAVGSVVGQLARAHGCRAVGIVGGAAKTRHLLEDLGFDAAVDYKAADFEQQLAAALPNGADVYFENVGGTVFDAVLPHLNLYARVALCGLASLYGRDAAPMTLRNFEYLLNRSVRMQAYRVSDYQARRQEIQSELAGMIRRGELRYHQTVLDGLEAAPGALAALMEGQHLGKQLVRVHAERDEPA